MVFDLAKEAAWGESIDDMHVTIGKGLRPAFLRKAPFLEKAYEVKGD
ncbi:hypothetical protein DW66_4160 [Pseudomonas putida]|nr:hypothetical protein DW66_4160 [Pseudomonas putida]